MTDIIKQLEDATEGSRELDIAVHIDAGLCDPSAKYNSLNDNFDWIEYHPEVPGGASELGVDELPHYTTSIDAALTLVPSNLSCVLSVKFNFGKRHKAEADLLVWTHDDPEGLPARFQPPWIKAATPALAICVAATKARQSAAAIREQDGEEK